MATYPLETLAPTVTAAGISAPTYTDILESLKAEMRRIYGSDIYIEPDSQDGQLLAVFARAISDCCDAGIASYNNTSPLTAFGEGLSSVVKINGITRAPDSYGQVNLVITGVVGTIITNGQARDSNGNVWRLPSTVTIPSGGTITVTATARDKGDIRAEPNTVTTIGTPTAGWNTVNNPAAATPGNPVETDAMLRRRQAASTALPAQSILGALDGAIKAVTGVTAVRIYVNDTGATDANGIPAHHLACVVYGGDSTEIATAIMQKRSPGVGLHGTTTVALTNNVSQPENIKFTVPTLVTAKTNINLTALTGYTTDVADKIKSKLVSYYNSLPIGQKVYWARALAVASALDGDPDAGTFEINTFNLFRDADSPAQSDIAIAWNEKPRGLTANISITAV